MLLTIEKNFTKQKNVDNSKKKKVISNLLLSGGREETRLHRRRVHEPYEAGCRPVD